MADKKENNKPLMPPKGPRGNYQVWVILATVAVIFGVIFFTSSTGVKKKNYEDLLQMVKARPGITVREDGADYFVRGDRLNPYPIVGQDRGRD